jgi:hypothetical protein
VSGACGADPLEHEGWVRRFVASPSQLPDQVRLYESLGFEVRLEPVPAEELSDDCAGCALALHFFRIIYTRRPT